MAEHPYHKQKGVLQAVFAKNLKLNINEENEHSIIVIITYKLHSVFHI